MSLVLIIVCVGVPVACLHFVNQVNHIEAMDNYNLVRMQEGQVIEVMQTGRFWKGFPSLPTANWHSLFDIRAALGFFCLLFAIVAFFVGQ